MVTGSEELSGTLRGVSIHGRHNEIIEAIPLIKVILTWLAKSDCANHWVYSTSLYILYAIPRTVILDAIF